MLLDKRSAIVGCMPPGEVAMLAAVFLLFTCGVALVAAAQRPGAHAALLERLGGLMLVSGLVGLGFELAQSAG